MSTGTLPSQRPKSRGSIIALTDYADAAVMNALMHGEANAENVVLGLSCHGRKKRNDTNTNLYYCK